MARPLSPSDPTPRFTSFKLGRVEARDDPYSDRIRCDHPVVSDAFALANQLVEAAHARGRSRLMVLADPWTAEGLELGGLKEEAIMPGYYRGEEDCHVMGALLTPERREPSDPEGVDRVVQILANPRPPTEHPPVNTRRATVDDAPAIAALVDSVFRYYPTPTGVPEYVARQIAEGIPFRLVEEEGEVIACASADLDRDARTAELTDCTTRPDQRGRGLMQALLRALTDDLRAMDHPTAFTLARAGEVGMNLAFLRLGFVLRGRMTRSCRIGEGIEDIHVWSGRIDD